MSLKSVLENSFVMKLAYSVTAAAIVGGGTVVLNNQSRIAVLETTNVNQESHLDRIETKIDTLLERMAVGAEKPR